MKLTSFPHLVKEWHPTKNGELTPDDFTHGSHKKVWWLCHKGHSYDAAPSKRTVKKRIYDTLQFKTFLFILFLLTNLVGSASALTFTNNENNSTSLTLNSRAVNAANSVIKSVVLIIIEEGFYNGQPSAGSGGTGFFISNDGYILTNAHVIAELPADARIKVQLYDGKTYRARVIGFDKDMHPDIGVIKIDIANSPRATLSNRRPKYGDWLLAIGHPAGYGNWLTTAGKYNNHFKMLNMKGVPTSSYEADIPIYSGSSGGPMLNLDGEVIAIINMSVSVENTSRNQVFRPSSSDVIWDWKSFRALKKDEENAVGVSIIDAMTAAKEIIRVQGNTQ